MIFSSSFVKSGLAVSVSVDKFDFTRFRWLSAVVTRTSVRVFLWFRNPKSNVKHENQWFLKIWCFWKIISFWLQDQNYNRKSIEFQLFLRNKSVKSMKALMRSLLINMLIQLYSNRERCSNFSLKMKSAKVEFEVRNLWAHPIWTYRLENFAQKI